MATDIAKAYVQIVPTAQGMQGNLRRLLGDDADRAGSEAGRNFADSFSSATAGAASALAPVSNAARTAASDIISTSAAFDAQMSKVEAITGESGEGLETLRSLAMEMGRTTKFSATEAAEGLEYMGMAGWKGEQMVAGLPAVLNLAAAAGEELGTTSDIVTDALTALGMTAEDAGRLTDIMAAAATNSNTNVSMMGESFKYAASLGGAMKFSAEDIAVALGLMANTGIKSTQAGTSLRNVMQRLAKPTKESATAMAALGIEIDDGHGNMLSFRQIMDQMRKSLGSLNYDQQAYTDGLAELNRQLEAGEITEKEYEEKTEELAGTTLKAADAQKAQYAAMLAGAYGLSGLLGIVNATDEDYQKLCDAIDNSSEAMVRTADGAVMPLSQALAEGKEVVEEYSGTAEAMAAVMQDNLDGRMTSINSRLESIKISLGDKLMPLLEDAADWAIKALDWFSGLDDGTQSLIMGTIGVVAVATPLLSIVSTLGSGISTLISVGGTLTGTVFPAISGWFSTLISGAGGTAAAIGGIATAALGAADAVLLAYDITALEEAHQTYSEAFEAHSNETATALDNFKMLYETKGPEVAAQWAAMVYQIDTTGMSLEQGQAALAAKVDSLWDGVPQNMWEGFKQGWSSYFGEGGSGLLGLLGDAFTGAVEGVQSLLGIRSPSTVFADIAGNVALGFNNRISSETPGILSRMSTLASGISNSFNGLGSNLSVLAQNAMTGLANGFISAAGRALQAARNVAGNIINTVRGMFRSHSPSRVFMDIGNDLMEGMELGIADNGDAPTRAVRQVSADITAAATTTIAPAQIGSASASDLQVLIDMLNRYLPQLANMDVMLNGNVVGTMAPRMDEELGNIAYYRRREAITG